MSNPGRQKTQIELVSSSETEIKQSKNTKIRFFLKENDCKNRSTLRFMSGLLKVCYIMHQQRKTAHGIGSEGKTFKFYFKDKLK